jgi:RimJ/RimL family protein N-acetyltransferase
MPGKFILETHRLILREFDEADVVPFYRMGSDPGVMRYLSEPNGGLKSVEHALEVLRARPLADYQKYGFGRWACVLKATGAVIGFAGLKYLAEEKEIDLGYRLLPAYWAQGLATEACRAVLEYGKTHLRIERIIALVDPENLASVRVLEKLGLKPAGHVEYHGQCLLRFTGDLSGRVK